MYQKMLDPDPHGNQCGSTTFLEPKNKMKATYLNVELGENVESFRLTKQSQNSGRQKNS
jgi:hypothetical protein